MSVSNTRSDTQDNSAEAYKVTVRDYLRTQCAFIKSADLNEVTPCPKNAIAA
jgi:hypothetical protein